MTTSGKQTIGRKLVSRAIHICYMVGESKLRKLANQRKKIGFKEFAEKLAPEVDLDVARTVYRCVQTSVSTVPNFPVMPDDTFGLYGFVNEDEVEVFIELAKACGLNADDFMEEAQFTTRWAEFVPVTTIGGAVRIISAWKRTQPAIVAPSNGSGIQIAERVLLVLFWSVILLMLLVSASRYDSIDWKSTGWRFGIVIALFAIVNYMLDVWYVRARRRIWRNRIGKAWGRNEGTG